MTASSAALPPWLQAVGGGVHAVDTGFQRDRFDAAWLVVDEASGRAAFVDTGTNHAVPRLLGALDALGIARDAVERVIPTHVHLDHAGGAGLLMRELPNARLSVHPRGVRHLADPAALWAGATAVYGEAEMRRSYGELVPVPADRIDTTADGQVLRVGTRELTIADTPGHARHHHCVWDGATRGWFTGDTFGLSYREFDGGDGRPWMLPTATPVQFEHDALKASIARLLARDPASIYLTHFGRVGGDVQALGAQLLAIIDDVVAMALAVRDAPDRHERLKSGQLDLYLRSLAAHGCALGAGEIADLLAMDLELNAQGIAIWLDRQAAKADAAAAP